MNPSSAVQQELVAASVARDVIWAKGADAAQYLQGQLSQDVAAMAPGDSAWSLLLQPRGKVDSWLRVTRTEDQTFLLDVDAGYGESTIERLERFKLRTDCELAGDRWSIVSLRGAGAADYSSVSSAGSGPSAEGVLVAVDAEWPGMDATDLVGERVSPPEGVTIIDADEFDRLRICAGVPAMGRELTEDTIPAEAGIVDRSVSFTKGCYVGQELVARIDSRGGNVPSRLCGLAGTTTLEPGDSIVVDGNEVGLITSAQNDVALAYVRRSVDVLPTRGEVRGHEVEVRDLPMC